MNTHVQVFLWTWVFGSLGYPPRSGIAGSHGNTMFDFLRCCQSMSKVAAPFYNPTSSR